MPNPEFSLGNLEEAFLHWQGHVLLPGNSLTSMERVDIFLRCVSTPELQSEGSESGLLTIPGHEEGVPVNPEQHESFFRNFESGNEDAESLNSMRDQLLERQARKRQGAFFTPELFASEARLEITRALGEGWESECVVWDNSAGTANLTRGLSLDNWGCLISSTAEKSDVETMKSQGWGGHHVFQYDFLNPDSESPFFGKGQKSVIPPEIDRVLREAAEAGKRLVFFMNPPYGTSGGGRPNTVHKVGVTFNTVNGDMRPLRFGTATQQLYTQFMFQCVQISERYGFVNHTVAFFSNPKFLSAAAYKAIRDWWYGKHSYMGGFMTCDKNMSDTSGRWGSCFTVWDAGPGMRTEPSRLVTLKLVEVKSGSVVAFGSKAMHLTEGKEASNWFKAPIAGLKGVDAPQMTSGLILKKEGQTMKGAIVPKAFFYFTAKGNSVMGSGELTLITSSCFASSFGGCSVLSSNWRRCISMYATRKLLRESWITDSDEFFIPDETLPDYEQWVNDGHVYALLHPSNNATAMRNVQYKGKSWNIKNHWFWRTRQSTLEALRASGAGDTLADCEAEPIASPNVNLITGEDETQPWETTGDPYFAYLLSTGDVTLSPDAQEIMSVIDSMWLRSLPMREEFYRNRPVKDKMPDLHLNAWDAGIYQMKYLWRELFPTEWKDVAEARKALRSRLQEGVYTYGFLRR